MLHLNTGVLINIYGGEREQEQEREQEWEQTGTETGTVTISISALTMEQTKNIVYPQAL
jgi:hypothetical protein